MGWRHQLGTGIAVPRWRLGCLGVTDVILWAPLSSLPNVSLEGDGLLTLCAAVCSPQGCRARRREAQVGEPVLSILDLELQ